MDQTHGATLAVAMRRQGGAEPAADAEEGDDSGVLEELLDGIERIH